MYVRVYICIYMHTYIWIYIFGRCHIYIYIYTFILEVLGAINYVVFREIHTHSISALNFDLRHDGLSLLVRVKSHRFCGLYRRSLEVKPVSRRRWWKVFGTSQMCMHWWPAQKSRVFFGSPNIMAMGHGYWNSIDWWNNAGEHYGS